jgi:hypothetical protein
LEKKTFFTIIIEFKSTAVERDSIVSNSTISIATKDNDVTVIALAILVSLVKVIF